MKFKDLLSRAKSGDQDAIHTILKMYKPLLLKESIVFNVLDEDLYQELCITVLHCIETFQI